MKRDFEVITLKKENISDFSLERNLLLSQAKKEWVFFKDSDEVISKDLEKEIAKAIKSNRFNGYYVARKNYLFGKELNYGEFSKYGWFGNSRLLRLARKNAGKWERPVHEEWKVKGRIGTLKSPLLHYSHSSLRSFLKNINHFSTLHAVALKSEGKKSGLIKVIVWPIGKFVYNYVFRLGFLDGMEGFIVALMMSFHSFLSWTKLYFLHS